MDRTSFYSELKVKDTLEFDYLDTTLSNFVMNYPVKYYVVSERDLLRPDLISYQFYGDVSYWWIICYVNNIYNVFTDLKTGMILKIPSTLDLFDFSKKFRKR